MYCPSCGKQIRDDSLFCAYCGAKMEGKPKKTRMRFAPDMRADGTKADSETAEQPKARYEIPARLDAAAILPPPGARIKKQYNIFAIAGCGVSLLSMKFNPYMLFSLAAVILSLYSLIVMDTKDFHTRGHGFALTGLFFGLVNTLGFLMVMSKYA